MGFNRNQQAKGDGNPYVKRFDEKYAKMTAEERKKVDKRMDKLKKLLGDD